MSSRTSFVKRERSRRAAGWLPSVAAWNAEGAVYGALLIGVLFAAEDAGQMGYPKTIGAAAAVLVLYWLTSIYAHNLGARRQTGDPVNWRLVWRSCLYELTILEGGCIPFWPQ